MLLNELISTILQILVFTLIPFIVYLITQKREESFGPYLKGFFSYIGLYRPTRKANLSAIAVSLLFVFSGLAMGVFDAELRETLRGPGTVIGKIRAQGFGPDAIILILLMAGFKTSFSEEILFRGFLAKRLMNWLGYERGNLIQAVIFGLVHLLLFWAIMDAGSFFLIFIFLFSGLAGYAIGYIKEKIGNGSIIPGWIAHGLGNVISYTVLGFVL